MKKSLLLLLLAIIAISCSDDKKERVPTYKDVVGTYTGIYGLYTNKVYTEDGDVTFQFTGTSNDNIEFVWNEISFPVGFDRAEDYQAYLWYSSDESQPKPWYSFKCRYSGNMSYPTIELMIRDDSPTRVYTLVCVKQ